MWVFPLLGAAVSLWFSALLARQFLRGRRPYELVWSIALLMYAIASGALALGASGGWTETEFLVFWLFGAVLTVPYLAAGEILLLAHAPWVRTATIFLLVFVTAFAVNRIRTAGLDVEALGATLPRGSDVFASDPAALSLARACSYVGFAILVAGCLWSAWRMRARPELRPRFVGTLLIAFGASVVAAGSAFAAAGALVGFSITNTVGVAVMFGGFVFAARTPARVER